MADRIVTVLGDIEPEALGVTLAHEHALFDLGALWEAPPPERAHLVDTFPTPDNRAEIARDLYHSRATLRMDEPAIAIAELRRFRAAGGRSVVDLTTIGLDPRPAALPEISRASGVQIVAGAGWYRRRTLPDAVDSLDEGALAEALRRAVLEGIAGTGVRAGILGELGTGSPIQPFEERQLRAAADVQRETGVGITVHPAIWAHEHLRIIDILDAAGADLSRVTISHCDQLVEPDWHARIAERGVLLAFDTFGSEFVYESDGSREPTDTERLDCLRRLLDAGRAGQLLVSHDVCSRLQLHHHGGTGYDHLLVAILPRLRAAGVGETELEMMLVANPRRLLAMPG